MCREWSSQTSRASTFVPTRWTRCRLASTPADWEKFKAAVRPAFEKYKGIGVRIEDDMLMTANGVRWMSEALPRKIGDIEDFIAKARRQSE